MPEVIVTRILRLSGYRVYQYVFDEAAQTVTCWVRPAARSARTPEKQIPITYHRGDRVMKELVLFALIVVLGFFSLAQAAEKVGGEEFLGNQYGWTISVWQSYLDKQDRRCLGGGGVECDSNKGGEKVSFASVCQQRDAALETIILWCLPSVDPSEIEGSQLGSFLELGYTKVCTKQTLLSLIDQEGVAVDCKLNVTHRKGTPVTRYVSFYHFRGESLGFSLVVRGLHDSSPTAQRIQELALMVQPVSPLRPSQ